MKITIRLGMWIPIILFGHYLAWTYYLTLETSLRKNYFLSKNPRWPPGVKGKKSAKFDVANDISTPHLDPFHFSQNPRWLPSVKGPKLAKFDLANYISALHLNPIHSIWTKYGMDILLDHRNKPAEEFFIYWKIQDFRQQSKVKNMPNWPRKLHFDSAFRSCSSYLD